MATTRNKISLGLLALVLLVNFASGNFGGLIAKFAGGKASASSSTVDLDTWEAPGLLKRYFPYYISGLDRLGQPVWVIEIGKWNFRKYFAEGGDLATVQRYADQMFYRWSKADKIFPNYQGGTGDYGLIPDFDGYSFSEFTNPSSIRLIVYMTQKFVSIAAPRMAYGNIINLNRVAYTLLNVVIRPILAEFFLKMETSGTVRHTWIPLLLRRIPKTSLPPWYGGAEKFTPLYTP